MSGCQELESTLVEVEVGLESCVDGEELVLGLHVKTRGDAEVSLLDKLLGVGDIELVHHLGQH